MPEELTAGEVLLEIRNLLRAILFTLGGNEEGLAGIGVGDFVYERVASTISNPVPAGAKNYKLLDWKEPSNKNRIFLWCGVGTDQHDNSYYRWEVDNVTFNAISGEAQVGTILEPFIFPRPIRVLNNIRLYIDNNNTKPYPNAGSDPSDPIPYEAVIVGYFI